jgi:ankyrin repeat protein
MDTARRASELGKALVFASRENKIVVICRLLSHGADVNYVARLMVEGKKWSITSLIQAALRGHADAVRVLMSRGAEVDKPLEAQLFTQQFIRGTVPSSFLIMGLMSMPRIIRDSLLLPLLLKKAISLLSTFLSSVELISAWPTMKDPHL